MAKPDGEVNLAAGIISLRIAAVGEAGRERALRGPRPRAAGGTNGTTVLDLAKCVPRLHGAVTAQRAIPTNFSFRV
jgi:hypothetical protein